MECKFPIPVEYIGTSPVFNRLEVGTMPFNGNPYLSGDPMEFREDDLRTCEAVIISRARYEELLSGSHTHQDRQAGAEIEVTPAMIEAGVSVLAQSVEEVSLADRELLKQIFLAMTGTAKAEAGA